MQLDPSGRFAPALYRYSRRTHMPQRYFVIERDDGEMMMIVRRCGMLDRKKKKNAKTHQYM